MGAFIQMMFSNERQPRAWVNTANILYIRQDETYTLIQLVDGKNLSVDEPLESLARRLNEATSP